jgi:hypothetical protein
LPLNKKIKILSKVRREVAYEMVLEMEIQIDGKPTNSKKTN